MLNTAGTVLFVGSNDHYVYALSTTDGTPVWMYETGKAVRSSPALSADGSTLYIGSDDSSVRFNRSLLSNLFSVSLYLCVSVSVPLSLSHSLTLSFTLTFSLSL